MGQETLCRATFNGKSFDGKARLEADALQFRAADLKLSIPFKRMKKISASGEMLAVTFDDGKATFQIGSAVARWLEKIRNPPTRLEKLGVRAEWRASVIGVEDRQFLEELEGRVAFLFIGRVAKSCDAIFFGVTKAAQLAQLVKLKGSLKPNGAIWVVRPKGRPEISERSVMAAGKAAGLVDVKVASFSPTHTAEKFVIPASDRPAS